MKTRISCSNIHDRFIYVVEGVIFSSLSVAVEYATNIYNHRLLAEALINEVYHEAK